MPRAFYSWQLTVGRRKDDRLLSTANCKLSTGLLSFGRAMIEYYAPLVLLFICSALTSYVATAIVKHAAQHIGLVDVPDDRKLHGIATPRLGGIAIIFGFGFPLLLLAANPRATDLVTKNLSYLFAVLA